MQQRPSLPVGAVSDRACGHDQGADDVARRVTLEGQSRLAPGIAAVPGKCQRGAGATMWHRCLDVIEQSIRFLRVCFLEEQDAESSVKIKNTWYV